MFQKSEINDDSFAISDYSNNHKTNHALTNLASFYAISKVGLGCKCSTERGSDRKIEGEIRNREESQLRVFDQLLMDTDCITLT